VRTLPARLRAGPDPSGSAQAIPEVARVDFRAGRRRMETILEQQRRYHEERERLMDVMVKEMLTKKSTVRPGKGGRARRRCVGDGPGPGPR